MQLLRKQRYSIGRVLMVVLAFYVLFFIIGTVAFYVTPMEGKTPSPLSRWNSWKWVVNQLASIVFSTLFYYYTVNSFHRLMAERKKFVHYLTPSVVALIGSALYFSASFYLSAREEVEQALKASSHKAELTFGLMVFSFVLSSIFFIGLSLLIAYLTFLRDEKKRQKVLEEQKLQLEMEKSQANLNFLKAQINPHFLHNTLNFLYAKSLPYSTELSEGILTLSDIMRYALNEPKDGRAPLKDEIEHVRNVIKINQLRFSNNLKVNFDVHGVVNGATIIPFVLITIVENAFKHGDLKSPEHPIDIRLDIQEGKLRFYCRNKKKVGPKELSTGIGLHNIKNQLELAYGPNYALYVKDEADFYTTILTIDRIYDPLLHH